MQNNECIRAKWKGKSMDVFSSCYSSVSVDFVCDRYSLEESKCKKSFDFACDCSFMSGTMTSKGGTQDGWYGRGGVVVEELFLFLSCLCFHIVLKCFLLIFLSFLHL